MPEYRRFISYIYDYQKGKKTANCGYAKVEVRNGAFRLRLHLVPAAKREGELKVYGFVRRDAKAVGIYLGTAAFRNNVCDFQAGGAAADVSNSGYSFDKLRGIWLRSGDGQNYITVWDDEPVAPEQFADGADGITEENEAAPIAAESEEKSQMKAEAGERKGSEEQALTEPELHTQNVQTQTLAQRWDNFLCHYPHLCPFEDEEITQCISIVPKDISFLEPAKWHLGKNVFVRQAYMRYHHLLLGCHENGHFVLAVPGEMSDTQEGHLARMYGFPEQKETMYGRKAKGEVCAAGETWTELPTCYRYLFL